MPQFVFSVECKIGHNALWPGLQPIPGSPEWQKAQDQGDFLPYESVVSAVDWNEDGDADLMAVTSYGYLCWFERSYLEHGYAPAKALQLQAK